MKKPKAITIILLSVMWFEMCVWMRVIVVCVEVNLGGDIRWEIFCVSWTLLLVNSQLWRHTLLLKWWMNCINNEFRTETGQLALTFPQLRFQETDILSSLLSLLPPSLSVFITSRLTLSFLTLAGALHILVWSHVPHPRHHFPVISS